MTEPDDEYITTPYGVVPLSYLERIAIVMESGGTLQEARRIAAAELAASGCSWSPADLQRKSAK
jgi:hypothetical protein